MPYQHQGQPLPSPKEGASQVESSNLHFLTRDLTQTEIVDCERSAQHYIQNDHFEIEIHNLNEINEYFRIFKDIVLKAEAARAQEMAQLKHQVASLQYQLSLQQGHPQLQPESFIPPDSSQMTPIQEQRLAIQRQQLNLS